MRKMTGIERLTKKKNFKELPALDKYVILSLFALIIYTVAEFVTSTITGISHDTLTTVFFAAFGGETLWCAILKKCKIKGGSS